MRVRLAAAVLLLAACAERPPLPSPEVHRLELLERALELRESDPAATCALLEEAGPGTVLERLRAEQWVAALQRADGSVAAWQAAVGSGLPVDLEAEARLGLARRLAAEGRVAEAASVLERTPQTERTAAGRPPAREGRGGRARPGVAPRPERVLARLRLAGPRRV